MPASHLVVLGSLNVDLVTTVEELPKNGQTIFSDSFVIENGGKGANQAVAASRLGANVTMVGRVGADVFSEQVLTDLKSERVDVSRITKDVNHSTGVALITVDSKSENTIVVSSGAIRPARAPASIVILHTVILPSIESVLIISPVYSITWPVAPAVPIFPIIASTTSFADTPLGILPSTLTSIVLGLN